MRVFIAGIDGYLGWTLAKHLAHRSKHDVYGCDNMARRRWVKSVDAQSVTPISGISKRRRAFQATFGQDPEIFVLDLARDYDALVSLWEEDPPDVIVHLAEMPSAPYSMMGQPQAIETHENNLNGTLNILHAMKEICPGAHLIKLGTMGEYGTPNLPIPEGDFELEYKGYKDRVLFPRQPGSWYHATKVHDTHNVDLACRAWGLKSTDIMQGVVYGITGDSVVLDNTTLRTRLDADESFGTAINRFVCQAIAGHPITLYGAGDQKRGFLPLADSMRCITLAINNPPEAGEYRTFNQFAEVYTLSDLAKLVKGVAKRSYGIEAEIVHYENPRVESATHIYEPEHSKLQALGYTPTTDMHSVLTDMFKVLIPLKDRILEMSDVLAPRTGWDGNIETKGVVEKEKTGKGK
jgi:UDP-sulfoquinovose synthase